MEPYIFSAGVLTLLLGLIHSVMGEILIFQKLRSGGIVPTKGYPLLKERNIRILWASWHLVSIFGWGLGIILLQIAIENQQTTNIEFIKNIILLCTASASLLVFLATKARHPGWIVLFLVTILLMAKRVI